MNMDPEPIDVNRHVSNVPNAYRFHSQGSNILPRIYHTSGP